LMYCYLLLRKNSNDKRKNTSLSNNAQIRDVSSVGDIPFFQVLNDSACQSER
jgi:hypothetical protein